MFAGYIVFVKVTLDNSLSYFVTTEAEITNNVIGFLSSVSETIQRAFFYFLHWFESLFKIQKIMHFMLTTL